MNRETEHPDSSGASISLSIPPSDPDLFKHKATSDVLLFLTNHRFSDFSLRELATQIGHSHQSVRRAVNVLSANDLITESPQSNQRLVQINRQRLSIPDDPILRIPQPEYHQPVKTAVTKLREIISDVVGIILYGSVARGDADRRSDIDLWVLTRSGRAESQREANTIARDLEDMEFDGDRYAYDIDVEAVQAIPAYTDDIREIIVSGIPVYKTSDFETVENLLLEEGAGDE
ncbi:MULTISPECIES: nucleotidyltransferase domain-containing protein [unclassified Halobacterium]|uniref:nucleotidyltransferase domain-containing protein n=1 Tax=unclassified Halobacterium TaxID=2668073 RepID=UPI001E3609B0|nr:MULTISPECIES: nucleotidyltransferase domain-containing protein [unclassified Halobacterium]MCD2201233.1 nucleotidyltransferase domain-containing protein [Halobacterium sp. KA-4]MCD2204074.1 nucleotidyltransferase domain-containing protein [Halobacterium sp. KA-6]